jgi:hypothetical protein
VGLPSRRGRLLVWLQQRWLLATAPAIATAPSPTTTTTHSHEQTSTVSAQFHTEPGSATAPSDYHQASGYVSFSPGQTQTTIRCTAGSPETVENALLDCTAHAPPRANALCQPLCPAAARWGGALACVCAHTRPANPRVVRACLFRGSLAATPLSSPRPPAPPDLSTDTALHPISLHQTGFCASAAVWDRFEYL